MKYLILLAMLILASGCGHQLKPVVEKKNIDPCDYTFACGKVYCVIGPLKTTYDCSDSIGDLSLCTQVPNIPGIPGVPGVSVNCE